MFRARQGLVMAGDGKCQLQSMRLQVTPDTLILQREELCYIPTTDVSASPADCRERVVKITRHKIGGLGISIKGGSEHKLPILISRITKNQAADRTGKLYVGDAIIKVNDDGMEGFTHDEAVEALRTAGSHVSLTVRHYGAAAPFLKGCLKKHTIQDNIHESPTLRVEEKEQMNQNEKDRASDAPKVDRKWVDFIVVPLLLARVARCLITKEQESDHAFEIYHTDKVKPVATVHCEDRRCVNDWIQMIAGNIVELMNQQIKALNKNLPPCEHVLWMGWVDEGIEEDAGATPGNYTWHPRYLAMKGLDMYLLNSPPSGGKDWSQGQLQIKVYQTALSVLKDSESNIPRNNCFVVQTSGGKVYTMATELQTSLSKLESAWHKAIFMSVTKLGSKTFAVNAHSCVAALTLDWNLGFALYDTEGKSYLWQYRFSQLKGSSDDGKTRLKLHFQSLDTREIETRELESSTLPELLYCMHAFLTAKVVSVDPNFLAMS